MIVSDFDIKNKVALITGGVSGIGLEYGLSLLNEGAKGITLADINEKAANEVLEQIEKTFGKNKAIFVKCDVTKFDEFENAFKTTIEHFGNIDILMNNAGICNDSIWEKEIAINLNGVIHGMLLGLDKYIPKYKTDKEGLIVNISSIAGCQPVSWKPLYCAAKYAVRGLTVSWGQPAHFERTKVRVVGICPGVTQTPILMDMISKMLGPEYEKMAINSGNVEEWPPQTPRQAVDGMLKITKKAAPGTIWVVEGGEEPYEFVGTDRHTEPKIYL